MSIFATLVLTGVIFVWWLAIRNAPQSEAASRKDAGRLIVGGGIVLPSLSIVTLLAFGLPLGHRMLPLFDSDQDVLRIDVTGHQWWWNVHYPAQDLRLTNELHIPAGVPVVVNLRATDVVHAFWVPRLAGKLDAIPGHTTVLKLEADEPGLYYGQCAEFCGLAHARMQFTVEAHAPEEFEAWLRTRGSDATE